MEITSLRLNLQALAGADAVLAIKATPHYPWNVETNTRSKEPRGLDVTVVCEKREFAKFTVTVMDGDYDKLFANGNMPMVSFQNFEAYYYRDFRSNEYVLKAKAEKMIPVNVK